MPVAITDFWRLLEESQLLSGEQVRQLAVAYGQAVVSPNAGDPQRLADWLIKTNVLSKYQTTILLAGRPGPFLFGEYTVYDRVESGRLAGRFRAAHRPSGHPVLLEFLTGPVISDPRLWPQAAQLARAASAIQSPHLQRHFELVDLGNYKFLASEDLRGSSLEESWSGGRMPPGEASGYIRLAALGLAQLHQAGRVHGDVRPANLWLEGAADRPANVKLLYEAHVAAGAAAPVEADTLRQQAIPADFMAPELAQPQRNPDALTDLYALGCTLYMLLTGSVPFVGGTAQQKLLRHATEPIRPLEPLGVPPPLAQLVSFLMAKNPAVRFQSAAVVAEQLAPLVDPGLRHVPIAAPLPTLHVYEHWLHQRPGAMPAAPSSNAVAPAPPVPIDLNIAPQRKTPAAAGDASAAYKAARKRKQIRFALSTAVVLLLLAAGGFYLGRNLWNQPPPGGNDTSDPDLLANNGKDKPAGDSSSSNPSGGTSKNDDAGKTKGLGSPVAVVVKGVQEVVPDDGKLLWASPTTGSSVEFRLVPPEGQVFLIARPADLLSHPEGPKVLDALGPDFGDQRSKWESAAGVKLEDVEQLIVGLHNNNGQFPRTSFVVRTKTPLTTADLASKWGQPMEQKEGTATWYAGKEWAYFVSGNPQDERTFLMASPADVREVAKVGGAPPALLRDVERLRRATDSQRHFTVLFYPAFLFNDDGQPLFAEERAKVREPLKWFLGEGLQAAQLSMHLTDSFYFEMRFLGSLDKERFALASEVRDRLQTLPMELEKYMDRLAPPTYWSRLARRYPLMVAALHSQMRVGVESDQAIVNSYLEAPAAHSLVLGGELLIASSPGAVALASVQPEPAGPKTIEEVLSLKTSMSFGSQSLEFAMRDIADDVRANLLKGSGVPFDIKLIGKDMEKDGITRNQTITDFKQEDKSVAEVLTAMVMKANSPAVPDPSLPGQKLIWVVAPDPDQPDRKVVLITTRSAAEREKYQLPAPFQPKT